MAALMQRHTTQVPELVELGRAASISDAAAFLDQLAGMGIVASRRAETVRVSSKDYEKAKVLLMQAGTPLAWAPTPLEQAPDHFVERGPLILLAVVCCVVVVALIRYADDLKLLALGLLFVVPTLWVWGLMWPRSPRD